MSAGAATATAAPTAQDATASGSRSAGGKDGADPAWASDAMWQRMWDSVSEFPKRLKVLELCG
eukprot:12890506-Prorocentrum_lima.AAC.1